MRSAVAGRRAEDGGAQRPPPQWPLLCAVLKRQQSEHLHGPVGGRKIDKSRSIGRSDGAVALAMALGLAERLLEPEQSPYEAERPEGFLFV